jgi:hypothetical protein
MAVAMKRVIRDKKTGKFFKDGEWTGKFSEATNFQSIPEAARACSRYGLKDTELLLHFGDHKMDVTLPICG